MMIQGKPMILRVADKCTQVVGKENVVISTPDNEIIDVCKKNDFLWTKSSEQCRTGTDRLSEFIKENNDSFIVNVQGDEPMISTKIIHDFIEEVKKKQETTIGISRIFDEKLVFEKSVVKVAISENSLIYASRNPLPVASDKGDLTYFKHTGIYGFSREDLDFFGITQAGSLEIAENIEILRLIENQRKVSVVEIPNYGRAVDTIADFEFVNKYGSF